MKKTIYTLLAAVACLATACENWLDQTASSEIRSDDHYATVQGFQQSLIGCYIAMADASLYGRDASWLYPELLAGQFRYNGSNENLAAAYFQRYEYGRPSSKTILNTLWAKAYNVVVNVNEALAHIDEKAGMLGETEYKIIKGELLAIRAYIHFDLARLYGYGNWAARAAEIDQKNAVPYVVSVSKNPTPQVSMRDFFTLLTGDLAEAARLLKGEDPITTAREWSYYDQMNADGFYNWRNLHLNYYAVRALQARVYLWEGSAQSKQEALAAAEEVISDFLDKSGKLGTYNTWGWMPNQSAPSYPAMAMEQIFALSIPSMATVTYRYIVLNYSTMSNALALYVSQAMYQAIYEGSATDWRAQNNLLSQSAGATTEDQGYVPKKLYQEGAQVYYQNRIPMIRLPEMYYIAAECWATGATPDRDKALEYLNAVREKRGLYEPLENLDTEAIMTEIRKEYRKEFIAEGVMFYYYKRLGITDVPYAEEEMGDKEYVIPYPDFEIQSGRVQ